MTTTKKQLFGALKVLNCETKLNYDLEKTLNGWNLYHKYQEGGGFGSQVAFAKSTSDMFQTIHAIRTLLLMEHQNKPSEYENQTKQTLKSEGYYTQEA